MDAAIPEQLDPRPVTGWRRAVDLFFTVLPKGALVLSVLTFAGYVMGLVRDRTFAHTYGASGELDAYNAAFVLPELLLDVLVAGALVAPFIPIFTGLKTHPSATATGARAEDELETAIAAPVPEAVPAADRDFGRTVLTWAVIVMAVTSAILFVFAPQSVALIAPGFQGDQRQLYIDLFRVMCVTPIIFAASIVLGEILVAEHRMVAYGAAPLLYNAGIVIGVLLLADRYGIFAAAIGAVLGALLHLAIRLVGLWRTPFRPKPRLSLRTRGLGEFGRLMVPKMISHPIEPLTFLFFTALASSLEPGSVSSVSFARNFASVPVSVVGAAFAIAAFPLLSASFADGDRRTFGRTFGRNFATISVLTILAAILLVAVGGLAIRILLGGGAFDEADIARTAGVLGVFALAIPLESMTHLLSRAVYATHETLLPSIASVVGFVVTVIVAESLVGSIGILAIPGSFAAGMGVKVLILAVVLVPRMARIGRTPSRPMAHRAGRFGLSDPARARLRTAAGSIVLVGLVLLAASIASATGTAMIGGVEPAVTPWVRVNAPASHGVVPPSVAPAASLGAIGGSSGGSSGSSGGGPASSAGTPPATPSPTPRLGPFSMDLYQKGDFVGEFTDIWCLSAAMQTSMNIMDDGADHTAKTQERLFELSRSIDPAPDGAAEPEGWAQGLTQLGYGNYEVDIQPSIKAAIHAAARQVRLTNRPAGLMVWRGAHSWVMSGFTASADPALTDDFNVTAVRIEDVWYPRFSTIWGYSRPPDASVPVVKLDEDFLPWKRPRGVYPKKDGNFVTVIPVE